jgi:hypothetical protein
VSWCSQTGFVISLKHEWLTGFRRQWLRPRCFAPKFCSTEYSIESLDGICFNLRLLGIPIKGTSYVYGDSMSSSPIWASLSWCSRIKCDLYLCCKKQGCCNGWSPCCPQPNKEEPCGFLVVRVGTLTTVWGGMIQIHWMERVSWQVHFRYCRDVDILSRFHKKVSGVWISERVFFPVYAVCRLVNSILPNRVYLCHNSKNHWCC